MNKKKGFTLVEVLAVVIVLGVISVIIYPVLNGILEDNRKKAFEQSLNGIARSAEMYKAANNNKFEVMEYDDENLELSYENNWVSGTISVEEIDGADKIYLSGFYDGEFCGTGYENHFSINKGECPSLAPDYCYDYSENTITYYHDEYSACPSVVTIPEDINGHEIYVIGVGAFSESRVSSVTLSKNLVAIAPIAFGDSNLKKLYTENASNLEYIGDGAFSDTYISNIDFSDMTSLAVIEDGAFEDSNLGGTLDFSPLKELQYIGDAAFEYNVIESVNITGLENLEYIGEDAFSDNTLNGNINIENNSNLIYIGNDAFGDSYSTVSLINISNNPKLEAIDNYAFGDTYIKDLKILNNPSLKYIREYAFYRSNLQNIDFTGSNAITYIGDYAFANNKLTTFNYNLPALTTIGASAFRGNKINSISFDDLPSLASIGETAFNDNQLPESSAYIYQIGSKELVSYGGTASSINLPNDTVAIGVNAFDSNKNITTANLSSNTSLTNIKSSAFYNCSNLTSLTLPNSLTTIGSSAFQSTKLSTVSIPKSVTSIGNSAFASNETWTSVTIEYNIVSEKIRFNSNWVSIGWPKKLLPPADSNVTLVTSEANNFSYVDNLRYVVTVPVTGKYKLEVWGAQGGYYSTSYGVGGKGGYSTGEINLTAGDILYVYVGGAGSYSSSTEFTSGGFNGGGLSTYYGGGGGGATDIRIGQDSLYSRVIVAGGGGGAQGRTSSSYKANGGAGGGTTGQTGGYYSTYTESSSGGPGGSQTSAGGVINSSYGNTSGSFGYGGNGSYRSTTYYGVGGGGGGWYGGGTGYYRYSGGGGGSGYVYTSSTASNYPSGCLLNSSYYLTNATTIGGNSSMPSTSVGSNETGHSGNGYARITFIS